MKGVGIVKGLLVTMAVAGFCLPQPLLASEAAPQRAQTATDVALTEGGTLIGQVFDAQGAPLARVTVVLQGQDQQVLSVQTDQSGRFSVQGLRGGVYVISSAKGYGTYRLWAPGTAPPLAQKGALVVAGQQTVRGQFGPLPFWLSNPWVIAGIVATAVAVPVAIHNADRPSSP